MPRSRLDTLLTERGLFESRARAAAAVLAGEVKIGTGGERARKPGQLVDEAVPVAVAERPRYVSRGGVKLENALRELSVRAGGRSALDVGASTGGFTDCLLQHGARRLIALDVAYGELHWSLRQDPRVVVIERTNARELAPEDLPYVPDLVTVDVSFISLRKVLPAIAGVLGAEGDLLALVKPQFEVGREKVGKGGVVRSAADRREALVAVGEASREAGLRPRGFASSGLPGPKGNLETFIWCDRGEEESPLDLRAAAEAVDP